MWKQKAPGGQSAVGRGWQTGDRSPGEASAACSLSSRLFRHRHRGQQRTVLSCHAERLRRVAASIRCASQRTLHRLSDSEDSAAAGMLSLPNASWFLQAVQEPQTRGGHATPRQLMITLITSTPMHARGHARPWTCNVYLIAFDGEQPARSRSRILVQCRVCALERSRWEQRDGRGPLHPLGTDSTSSVHACI